MHSVSHLPPTSPNGARLCSAPRTGDIARQKDVAKAGKTAIKGAADASQPRLTAFFGTTNSSRNNVEPEPSVQKRGRKGSQQQNSSPPGDASEGGVDEERIPVSVIPFAASRRKRIASIIVPLIARPRVPWSATPPAANAIVLECFQMA